MVHLGLFREPVGPCGGDGHYTPVTSLRQSRAGISLLPPMERNMVGDGEGSLPVRTLEGVPSHAAPPASPRALGRAPSPEVLTTLLKACPALSSTETFGDCAATVLVKAQKAKAVPAATELAARGTLRSSAADRASSTRLCARVGRLLI